MNRAFLVGVLIAIIAPIIGVMIVLKRYSMIGDALSHNTLAGVTMAIVANINPIVGAFLFSILSALTIERIRKYFSNYNEMAISIVMSTGVGLAGVLSGFVKDNALLNNFLFGSIVAISDFELYMIIALSVLVILVITFLYKDLFYITFDEEGARLSGVKVGAVNFVFMLLAAITIAISARAVGTLVISSLMTIPAAAAMKISKSFKTTLLYAIVYALVSVLIGIFISFYVNLKPGGTIVMISVALLLLTIALTKDKNR
ncbi:MAG: metal ABC transporter permease [Clostridiales bacterium]|nr:metal ABC transporter permease [Clostridiales bacterium]